MPEDTHCGTGVFIEHSWIWSGGRIMPQKQKNAAVNSLLKYGNTLHTGNRNLWILTGNSV
jgi:hypothetical protein